MDPWQVIARKTLPELSIWYWNLFYCRRD